MRNVTKSQDSQTLSLLQEGAEAAAAKPETDRKLAQLADQIRMLQYALGNVFKTLGDYPQVKQQIDQLDYRTLGFSRAIAELGLTADFAALVEKHALAAKVDAFNELSDKDDVKRELTNACDEVVSEEHSVILTSECAEASDQGIFRSKMDVGGEEFASVKNDFLGKKVGESFTSKIQGKDHVVTILGLRKKPNASTQV